MQGHDKLDTTEAQVRKYFKDVLGVQMMQSKDNLTRSAILKFSDREVGRVLGRQKHFINGTPCSLQPKRSSDWTPALKRKTTCAAFGEAPGGGRVGGGNFGDPSRLKKADGSKTGKVGRVKYLEEENSKRKEQILRMKSLIRPLRDEVVRQMLLKKGEEIGIMKEEITAKDRKIEEQTKLITSLKLQVEKEGQINEEQLIIGEKWAKIMAEKGKLKTEREELEANKAKVRELEVKIVYLCKNCAGEVHFSRECDHFVDS